MSASGSQDTQTCDFDQKLGFGSLGFCLPSNVCPPKAHLVLDIIENEPQDPRILVS